MSNIFDRRLWGNEAADDENPEVLNSYFLSNVDFEPFFSHSESLMITRARKGMGKSALINEFAYRLSKSKHNIVINIKGSDLIAQQPVNYLTPDEHIHDWMQRICLVINREIGSRIDFAFNDDEILLVESSEIAGYKRRNLFGSLLSRLKLKIPSAELISPKLQEDIKILERITSSEKFNIWLLVDDIDATFINTEQERLRLSTFFSTCREIASSYKGVKIRTTIRTDVWASIRKDDESLDKAEQYTIDLTWTKTDIGKLLSRRIHSFEKRVGDLKPLTGNALQKYLLAMSELTISRPLWEKQLDKVFWHVYPWGTGYRPPSSLIHMLGAGRPRWVLQLCRMAAQSGKSNAAKRITIGMMTQVLPKYSSIRLDDICREHNHQCPNLPEMINLFSNNNSSYTTEELLAHIDVALQKGLRVTIDGTDRYTPLELARFLFQVNFYQAQRPSENENQYYTFDEKPELLKYESNPDDGMQWTIHPAFRAALNIKHVVN
ncbi:P-loop ATPase, Sll1717 family [Desulforhopalus sp. IMCC35007]|uniref:P-loop ATPase, Sll1717 family n=1 Tax=Desulforhopalus sp. IMCC35007 TaxID=2569543 RepID=UPI0010AEB2DF|nr:hypothetical protein [Desulforhopalus sp. IMCC35007]TKB07676.1 hypothetical protein FCL48_16760 [Desulforhopalus sp. IMCC35007]